MVKENIRKFKVIVDTSGLTSKKIDKGWSSKFGDFEDALQYYCAINADCSIIITRNGKDFKESALPVMTPNEYLKSLND